MTTYSVSRQSESKEYLWLVPDHGLELGFGAKGEYEAHAHRHFVDVMFSPLGLLISPGEREAQLAIVQPRIAFGPTIANAFFFMKFLPAAGEHAIPDKVTGRELESYSRSPLPEQLVAPFAQTLSHFDPRDSAVHHITFRSDAETLQVVSTAGWELTIAP